MTDVHIDPQRRHDFVFLFDVTDGNPNGDPDAGNLPRLDPETLQGIVTDVAMKRRIRNYAAAHGERMFIQSEVSLNSLISKAFHEVGLPLPEVVLDDEELIEWFAEHAPDLEETFSVDNATITWVGESTKEAEIRKSLLASVERGDAISPKLRDVAKRMAAVTSGKDWSKQRGAKVPDVRQQMCRDYYDVRMFGAVLQTGLNAGQLRGPMQMTFARSLDRIVPLEATITRIARTTAVRMASGPTEMGRKSYVPYGLYRAHGFYSPRFAQETGVTAEDLRLFWQALGANGAATMWDLDRSASRGLVATRGLYVFSHESALGNAPAHRLFELVRAERHAGDSDSQAAHCFADYRISAPSDGTLAEFAGVTLTRLV